MLFRSSSDGVITISSHDSTKKNITCIVINSRFVNSSASPSSWLNPGGTIVLIDDSNSLNTNIYGTVINSTFINSSVNCHSEGYDDFFGNGGAIFFGAKHYNAKGNVINSTFINSSVNNEKYYNNNYGCGNGGAIYIQNGNVTNCTFINSSVNAVNGSHYSYGGGAIQPVYWFCLKLPAFLIHRP